MGNCARDAIYRPGTGLDFAIPFSWYPALSSRHAVKSCIDCVKNEGELAGVAARMLAVLRLLLAVTLLSLWAYPPSYIRENNIIIPAGIFVASTTSSTG